MAATFKVSDEVRDVLSRSTVSSDGTDGWSLALPENLDRKLYLAVNKVIEGAGGSWVRKRGLHLFPRDPREALGLAVESGVAVNEKTLRQAFYSPPEVARKVVELAEFGESGRNPEPPHLHVLEPSAGEGALVNALFEVAPYARVDAYDTDPKAVLALNLIADELAFNRGGVVAPHARDFLSVEPSPIFDRVLMNPPWTGGQDVRHVLHALQFLKPGGLLVAVMPSSANPFNRPIGRLTSLRAEWLRAFAAYDGEWHPLPDGSFRESGTDVRCGIAQLRLRNDE